MNNLSNIKSTVPWFIFSSIILLAAALRFYDLGGESYWYDEIIMVRVVQDNIWAIIEGGRPHLFIILAHFWVKLFGTEEVATRSLSALFGVASIPVIYLIGKELLDRKVGLIGAFLMAISQFQIYYSQDFRYYSLFGLTTLLSFYFFLIALRSRNIGSFISYVLFTVLLFYTHTFGVFIIVIQNLYFLIRWKHYRKLTLQWIASQAIIIFTILPRIIKFSANAIEGKAGPMKWLPEPSVWAPLITFRNFIGAGLDYPSWNTVITGIGFFVVATATYIYWKGKDKWLASLGDLLPGSENMISKRNELLLLVLWSAIPILLPLTLSKIFGPMYHDRYMISASPAFYIILAFLITRLGRVVPESITLGLLVIVITPGLLEFYVSPVREQWREAAEYVQNKSTIDDVIIFAESGRDQNRGTFNWYYKGDLSECGINGHLKDYVSIDKEFVQCKEDAGRFWLVVREVPYPAPYLTDYFLRNTKRNIKLITERRFTKITVYLFQMM
ncbi:MAG: glycosyltransferase family 39 protein [Thermodesulfobacteriota bacterium]